MVLLVPTVKDLTTTGFAKLSMREVLPHYGCPAVIMSDTGSQWNSAFFRANYDQAGASLILSAAASHPQTNGLVERTNEVIATCLRHCI